MNKKELIAPCGLDCFNCGVYMENITDTQRDMIAARRNIPPEEAPCKGCKPKQGKCLYAEFDCETWKCVQEKGLSYCFECAEFPCGLLAPTAKGASYPHNMKVYNLCRMKLYGLDAWIAESAHIRKRYYEGDFVVGQGPVLQDE